MVNDLLEKSLSNHEHWYEIYSVMVIVGVLGETAAEIFFDWDPRKLRKIATTTIFALFVFIGVTGEWSREGKISDAYKRLRQGSDIEILRLQRDVQQLHEIVDAIPASVRTRMGTEPAGARVADSAPTVFPSAATNSDQESLAHVRAYPVPWKPYSGGKYDSASVVGCGTGIIFDHLIGDGTIRIYSMLGDNVREIGFLSGDNGCKSWDGKNSNGRDVASGIYIAIIKSTRGKAVKKMAIER